MLASLPSELLRSLRLTLVVFAVTGLVYPLVGTGIAQALFHSQANGSLVTKNGRVIGSSLLGQEFTSARYFHGRVSETVNPTTLKPEPYAADNSAGSNLGPNNKVLIDRVSQDIAAIRKQNGLAPDAKIPVDLVTADFSGLDPNITEAGALIQVDGVAKARNLDPARVRALVENHVQGRMLGIFGEPHVNVFDVNLALDGGGAG